MSVTRGMGACVWTNLQSQYQEASGTELLVDGNMAYVDFSLWTTSVAGSFTKVATVPPNTVFTQSGRIAFTGTNFPGKNETVLVIGRTYRARGWFMLETASGGQNATVYSGVVQASTAVVGLWVWFDVTFVATSTLFQIQVGGAGDASVLFTGLSVQEVLMKTLDVGDYCDSVSYLLSNRGGAQECASLTKLETVDRHTGVVETVADFSVSPGPLAVITLPAGFTFTCPSANRTTQTSTSTLVTGLAANAAPWRDAGGGKGLSVESERIQYIYQSRVLNGPGWTNSGTCVVTPNADAGPSGDGQACQVAFSAAFDSVNRAGTAYAGNCVISAWRKQGTGTKSNFYVTDGGAHGPSLNNLTASWARYDYAYLNAAGGTAYYVDASWGGTPPDLGTRFDDFTQVERGLYPSSAIWSTNLLITRAAATLTVPLDVCNTLSGKIPRFTIVPAFAYNETAQDLTICDDSRAILYYEQSTQKFVYEVRGRGRIASLACTFSREQSLVVRGDMDEATGLMTLVVSGCTTGNGTFQTYAAPKKAVVCGDGYTAATFPTQLGPSVSVRRGDSFDGGDWFDLGLKDYFEWDAPFTMGVLWIHKPGAGQALFCTIDDADATSRGLEIEIEAVATDKVRVLLNNVYPSNCILVYSTTATGSGLHSLIVSYDGSGLAAGLILSLDGRELTKSVSINVLSSTIRNGKKLIFGARYNGAGKLLPLISPNVSQAFVFPRASTMQQIRLLHNRLMSELSI